MARNESLGPGMQMIAQGYGSLQLPEYVTINTGKYSPDAEKVQVVVRRGNKERELGLFSWVKMSGVRVSYHRHGRYLRTTLHDNTSTTILATREWKVQAEPTRTGG